MFFSGGNFNITNITLFRQCVEGIRKSITTPDHFFCSDNMITWNKNLSFLQNDKFLESMRKHSNTNIELAIIWRTYILCYFANYAKRLRGDFVEVGAYKGNTASIILDNTGLEKTEKRYYLYDTFEHSDIDLNHILPEHSNILYDQVRSRFERFDFVKVIQGYVPESFSRDFPEKIAFAHVDLNQAPAEVGALRRIIPVLSPGAVIILDDYGWWVYHEQKEAEDPLFAEYGLAVLELPTGQGLVLNHRDFF
ncbi:class I SAM-dependent methyltransferase [Thiocystis violascens]|uniref:Macrocin-O-methyltransferase (TylF) n=1 Tax=Thiocystis violascens (strain ATCC 17096 / DSM 198 / 6111) TaxID=765911 RepID=I3Y7F2_THIV6|nr:class I SAM-dependent methyltransferase [Thiocystis violascens]AFL72920.1 hypothetical protein Thivi_0882 [Thiocystis violascens DSM 198]